MTRISVEDALGETDLLQLRDPVATFLARAGLPAHEVEDLVQETLLRVWEVRGRVDRGVAAAYAVATARNLVQSRDRSARVHDRHAHRLHEPATVDGPEPTLLRSEERLAFREALAGMPSGDRELLTEAYGDVPPPVAETSGRRRTRLARARSRARVDYLLRLRRVALPTARCRPVLDALSSGDRREQERAGAAEHLLTCEVCDDCADALLTRKRGMFGVVAVPLLVLWQLVRGAPRTSAGVAAGTAVAAGALVLALSGSSTPPPATAAPAPVPAAPAAPATPAGLVLDRSASFDVPLAPAVGRPVTATAVLVRSVPADEGFWVGPDDRHQFFVHLVGAGESPVDVRPGAHVSFSGTVAVLDAAARAGLDGSTGLPVLQQQGAYLSVPSTAVTLVPAR